MCVCDQCGSVELLRDTEGCHFASTFVNITRGTYEGQLVSATCGFIHPVKPFQVIKNDDIIILQFSGDAMENRGMCNTHDDNYMLYAASHIHL